MQAGRALGSRNTRTSTDATPSRYTNRGGVHHRRPGRGRAHDGGPGDGLLTLTDSGSLTASELVRRLRIGPPSVSKAVTCLESQSLARRERDVVDDDVWYQSMMASARSTAQLVETSRRGISVLGPGTQLSAH
ncbi:MarR family transcriptional regulator [Streptomyces sp. LN785]|uniref:MarR family transcriptional regulator n=1 Tax=Streptomyces sp. LN785 TaxID=3112983 RepID=UPI003723CA09